ncbi:MAG: hypothetical protein JSV09_00875 [Thermoplasmata archaeon]|nr:MAG: hypothetical protein JSV09_00875 [Thermoplasmata archaeon]
MAKNNIVIFMIIVICVLIASFGAAMFLLINDNGEDGDEEIYPRAEIRIESTTPYLMNDLLYLVGTNSSDSDGEIIKYEWFIDDQPYEMGETIYFTPETTSAYEASLIVTDNDGHLNKTVVEIDPDPVPSVELDITEISFQEEYRIDVTYGDTRVPISELGTDKVIKQESVTESSRGGILDGDYFDVDEDNNLSKGDYIILNYTNSRIYDDIFEDECIYFDYSITYLGHRIDVNSSKTYQVLGSDRFYF